jgi:hypothetical protein
MTQETLPIDLNINVASLKIEISKKSDNQIILSGWNKDIQDQEFKNFGK